MQINDSNFPPGDDLFVQIRASFIKNRTTFSAWCRTEKVGVSNARMAIYGHWNGPKGKKLRAKAIEASGLKSLEEMTHAG